MKSNPLELYDLKDGNGKGGNKRAFSFVAKTRKGKNTITFLKSW